MPGPAGSTRESRSNPKSRPAGKTRAARQGAAEPGRAEPARRSGGADKAVGDPVFRAVFEGASDAILLIDPETGGIVDANPGASRLLGYPRGALLRLGLSDLLKHENGNARSLLRDACHTGAAQAVVAAGRTRSGGFVPVELTSSRVEGKGRPLVVLIARPTAAAAGSDDELRRIAEVTPIPLLISRMSDSVILFANRWVGPALGLPADDVVGRMMRDFYADPGSRDGLIDTIRKRGYIQYHEMQMCRADGRLISTNHSIQKLTFQGEDALVGAFYDLTERVKAEEERRVAEERLRDAIESIVDGLVLFDENDRVVIWNQRFAELYPELKSLLPHAPTAEDMFRARYEAGAVGEFGIPADEYVSWRMEMRRQQGGTPAIHRHSDGRWFRTTERKTREGGIVATSTDITELKLAQTRLMDAIESIDEGFAYFDSENCLVFCNENFRDHWPAMRGRLVPGISFTEIASMAWDHGYVRDVELGKDTWLKQRLELQSKFVDVVRQTGPETWIKMNERPVRDGGFVQIVADISDSVKSEIELRAAKDQAELASRTKTEFLANMSHELRTPLNAINGFSEAMCREMFGPLGDPRYKGYADDIHASGIHLLSLINDILDLSKIEAGKHELDEAEVDVAATVLACLGIVKERAREGEVEIVNEAAGPLPGLRADERALKQIAINLLANAIKFTPPGGSVSVSAGTAADGRFDMCVRDTGIGIAAKDMATAMAPFGQIEGHLSGKQSGTGLGLPLVNSLMQLHGGTIEITSEPGAGTEVRARFPAARVIARK